MKLKMGKVLALMSAFFLVFSVFSAQSFANSNEVPGNELNYQDGEYEPESVKGIVIFAGTYAVGEIASGVISYTTGSAPSEWVEMGLDSIENAIRNRSSAAREGDTIRVSNSGNVSICVNGFCQIAPASQEEK